jgi:hypothetical protein
LLVSKCLDIQELRLPQRVARTLLCTRAAGSAQYTMRLRLTLIASLILAPSVAAAQTTTTTTPQVNEPTIVIANGSAAAFNQATCNSGGGSAITYDLPSSFSAGAKITIYITDQSTCSNPPPSTVITTLQSQTALTTSNQTNTLSIEGSVLEPSCPANVTKDFLVCAVTTVPQASTTGTTTTDTAAYTAQVTVTYDSQPPNAPSLTSATAGDSAIYLTWGTQSDVDHFIAYYKTDGPAPTGVENICNEIAVDSGTSNGLGGGTTGCLVDSGELGTCDDVGVPPGPDAGPPDTGAAIPPFDPTGYQAFQFNDGTAGSGKVSGLVNNQRYTFVLVAVDLAGNVSPGSNSLDGTPLAVLDFYKQYRCAGGDEKGGFGCSTAGAVLVPAGALGIVALLRRRRKA